MVVLMHKVHDLAAFFKKKNMIYLIFLFEPVLVGGPTYNPTRQGNSRTGLDNHIRATGNGTRSKHAYLGQCEQSPLHVNYSCLI